MSTFACSPFITPDDIEPAQCACSLDFNDEDDQARIETMIDAACDTLVRLSGFRFSGLCESIVRPCSECCRCTACGCCHYDFIELQRPLIAITSVRISGEEVDWKVLDGYKLVKADGTSWPGCQNVLEDADADGSFVIEYVHGYHPDAIAQAAAVELTCQLLRECYPGNKRSKIPGAINMSGGGVNVQIDRNSITEADLPAVARFVGIWNPRRDKVYPAVFSPELDHGWQQFAVN